MIHSWYIVLIPGLKPLLYSLPEYSPFLSVRETGGGMKGGTRLYECVNVRMWTWYSGPKTVSIEYNVYVVDRRML